MKRLCYFRYILFYFSRLAVQGGSNNYCNLLRLKNRRTKPTRTVLPAYATHHWTECFETNSMSGRRLLSSTPQLDLGCSALEIRLEGCVCVGLCVSKQTTYLFSKIFVPSEISAPSFHPTRLRIYRHRRPLSSSEPLSLSLERRRITMLRIVKTKSKLLKLSPKYTDFR